MKLYGSLTSPFVRACRIAAIELRLPMEIAPTVVRPTEPNRDFGANMNPLRRIPALLTDDGKAIVDSRVIVEYLNGRARGDLLPSSADQRIDCLNRHAIVAGATEALVSAMYERKLRPEDKRWPSWADDQIDKAGAALDWAEGRADDFGARFDLGAIGLVCLLGYAAFRFPQVTWFDRRPALKAFEAAAMLRESVSETAPRE